MHRTLPRTWHNKMITKKAQKATAIDFDPVFCIIHRLGTATRLSICRGSGQHASRSSRSNSRAYKYSLAIVEPEIQAIDSPIATQDFQDEGLDEVGDTLADLEPVRQKGTEKTDSFFTK